MPKIPGTPDTHRIITPACRQRPDEELTMEAVDHIEESIEALLAEYGPEEDVTIHVAVTVEG